MGITEASQFVVDKLAPVVRVQNQDGEWKMTQDGGERSKHNNLRTAGDRDNLCPSRTTVGDREGITMIPCCLPPS